MSPVITAETRVELADGQFKRLGELTPEERQVALEVHDAKMALTGRWLELVDELGEAWIPQTPIVMRMGARDLPTDATLAQWREEVAKLEAAVGFRNTCDGSAN